MKTHLKSRKGAVAIFLCFLMLPLLALLALSVDYGFLLYVRTDLQRTADQAAIAGIRDILPDAFGNQDFDKAKATIRDYVAKNLGDGFEVLDSDIEFGRFDKSKIYDSVDLQSSGIYDTVRVSVRNDEFANNSISLYFARLFGSDESDISVTSTAILQPARYLGPGTAILPIVMEETTWNQLSTGDAASVYGDGHIEDEFGQAIPGNWGTVDIGAASNSTAELTRQIEEGLSQGDLDSLYQQNVIDRPEFIDSQIEITVNGDTGFSAGMKHAVTAVEGQTRLIPIYKEVTGHGGNLYFEIVGWGVVEVVDSGWNGSQKSYVQVRKSNLYDQHLLPTNDLTDATNVIEGAYTSPALVE